MASNNFFKYFPTRTYDFFGDGVRSSIVDIFRNVALDDIKIDELVAYTRYEIQNNERPDVVSYKLYKNPDYHWTFFVVNDGLRNGVSAWPKTDSALEKFISEKYDGYFAINPNTASQLHEKVQVPVTDIDAYTGETVTYYTERTLVENSSTLNGLNFPEGSLAFVTDGGYVLPVLYTDATRNQIVFVRDGINKVSVLNSGNGYVRPPTLKVISASGTGAVIDAVIGSSGEIASVRICATGSGYKTNPSITVSHTPTTPGQIIGTVYSGKLTDVLITNPGLGYCKVPRVVVSSPKNGGTSASVRLDISPITGSITSALVTSTGSGYGDTEAITLRIETDADDSSMLYAKSISDDEIAIIPESTLKITTVNKYSSVTNPVEYTLENSRIAQWLDTTFYTWVSETLQYSYRTKWTTLSASEILSSIEFGVVNAWISYRYAHNSVYVTATSREITFNDARGKSTDTLTYKSNVDYEQELNDASRAIRVVRPENIMQFTDAYRDILNA